MRFEGEKEKKSGTLTFVRGGEVCGGEADGVASPRALSSSRCGLCRKGARGGAIYRSTIARLRPMGQSGGATWAAQTHRHPSRTAR